MKLKKFKRIQKCVNCGQRLTRGEVMYSRGCCPKCGHIGENAVTIVDTVSEVVEVKRVPNPNYRWWNPFEPRTLVVEVADGGRS